MRITTSATDKDDWFHEPTLGWCFSQKTPSQWFNFKNVDFDYSQSLEKIKNSKTMEDRMSIYIKYSGENALPSGDLRRAPYIPVGIINQKESTLQN